MLQKQIQWGNCCSLDYCRKPIYFNMWDLSSTQICFVFCFFHQKNKRPTACYCLWNPVLNTWSQLRSFLFIYCVFTIKFVQERRGDLLSQISNRRMFILIWVTLPVLLRGSCADTSMDLYYNIVHIEEMIKCSVRNSLIKLLNDSKLQVKGLSPHLLHFF